MKYLLPVLVCCLLIYVVIMSYRPVGETDRSPKSLSACLSEVCYNNECEVLTHPHLALIELVETDGETRLMVKTTEKVCNG